MRNFLKRSCATIASLFGGSSKPSETPGAEKMPPAEFTRMVAGVFRKKRTGLEVEIVADMELKLVRPDREGLTSFLYNTYEIYQRDPDAIDRLVATGLEAFDIEDGTNDPSRIVPVIKDRPWLAESIQALAQHGRTDFPEPIHDDFGADLVVLYAEDSERGIRYLDQEEFEKTKIDRKDLRALACENLKRLLPDIEHHGAPGFYMITADGNYEASLLLLDSIWTAGDLDVKGEIVVAIPTRDVLLVTGTGHPEGIEHMKVVVKKATEEGAYRLTSKLFVYRNGKFEEFKDGTDGAMNSRNPSV
ncbi:DUF1444 family protein [Luteolibacter sp. Populi]|uniref:DUF1444 family protein n=1 Tax=Luteolibacter sp. Populi TaxID=3230487 RepID=UPI0034668A00